MDKLVKSDAQLADSLSKALAEAKRDDLPRYKLHELFPGVDADVFKRLPR